jgi:sugar phosphate isomerase/epimerase
VDDVELVLFESDEISNIPKPEDVKQMAGLAGRAGLSFTVHLPLDIHLGHGDDSERRASIGKCRRVIERMRPLDPFAWILHLHGDKRGSAPSDEPARWASQNRRSLTDLLNGGPDPEKICVETLDYDFSYTAGLIEEFGLSVCLDIGHLLANGRDVGAHLDGWLERTRVLHIHGVRPDGTDHVDLGYFPPGLLENLAERLAGYPGRDLRVVTMEVFGRDPFERSMRVIKERLAKWLR